MKRLLTMVLLALLAGEVQALEVAGVSLPDQVTVSGQKLQLNGHGIRKKMFFDIYLGSLYTADRVDTAEQALGEESAKLLRMDFLHSKVGRQKIVDAFAEGFEKNAPELLDTAAARNFLNLFTRDFLRGDTVELELAADGAVTVRHNETVLGTEQSPDLVRGVLLIYLGNKPADAGLKKGLLGGSLK